MNDQIIKLAISNIFVNKVRSILTMLGIVIGVFSVIVLVAIGSGIENFIVGQFNALGSNLLFVSPGTANFSDDPAKAFSRNKLSEKHLDLIRANASDVVAHFTPSIRLSEIASHKTKTYTVTLIGGSADGLDVMNYEIATGRFFSEAEVRSRERVAVLGDLTRTELFGTQDPLGQSVQIGDEKFTVIGTFLPKGQNLDQNVLAPFTAVKEIYNIETFSSIAIKLKEGVDPDLATRKLELAMLRDLKEDDFSILSQADVLASIQNILRISTAGIGAIAGISLVVGGVGIMNIMLVSVTERIHEIGLRKALGATSRAIALQFLLEALFISLVGGLIGLLLGWLASLAASSFIQTSITGWSVFLAIGFSCLVGLVFGTYPAIQASKKDPIEALRYE